MTRWISDTWQKLNRLKTVNAEYVHHTEWTKSLGSVDFVGIASATSLPIGVFMLVPYCAKLVAGPSVVLSALLAFSVAIITGMHQAELVSHFRKSCLLYSYTYAVLGEFWAFLLAWMTILDYGIAASCVAKIWSSHANLLFNSSLHKSLLVSFASKDNGFLEEKFDFLALIGLLLASLILATNIRAAGTICIVMAIVCALIVASSTLVAFFYADPVNWIKPGFFPFGYLGIFKGATYLLYGYIGVEILTCILEETSHPDRRIRLVAPLCNSIVSIYFFLLSIAITLALDFTKFPSAEILPQIYGKISIPASRYVLSVGSVCGLSGSLLGILIPMPRVFRMLGSDRLLCARFGRLTGKNGVPYFGLLASCFVTGILLMARANRINDILCVSLPLRFLMTVLLTMLQRYSVPICSDFQEPTYHRMNKHHSTSFITLNGSVITVPHSTNSPADSDQEDLNSIASSVLCRKIAIAQLGSQNDLQDSKSKTEKSTLLPPGAQNGERSRSNPLTPTDGSDLVRSVSKYHAINPLEGEDTGKLKTSHTADDSLRTVSLESIPALKCTSGRSHNCLKSPCSPHSNDPFHVYERDLPEIPFVDNSDGFSRSPTFMEHMDNRNRACKLLCAHIFVSTVFGFLLTKFPKSVEGANGWILAALALCLLLLLTVTLFIRKLQQNPQVFLRKRTILAFPFLSMIDSSLLVILLCTNSWLPFGKLFLWMLPGFCLYFCYSFQSSLENRGQNGDVLLIQNTEAEENAEGKEILDANSECRTYSIE